MRNRCSLYPGRPMRSMYIPTGSPENANSPFSSVAAIAIGWFGSPSSESSTVAWSRRVYCSLSCTTPRKTIEPLSGTGVGAPAGELPVPLCEAHATAAATAAPAITRLLMDTDALPNAPPEILYRPGGRRNGM
jgi:hypothetical protein